ncbi:MAG: hypothetical protein B7Z27_00180, partial [Sphingobacteriia bacterium 32-37-4]
MKKTCLLLGLAFFTSTALFASSSNAAAAKKVAADNDIIGRWDLTVNMDGRIAPSWLEVKLSGVKTLVGYFVADGGSARPISHVQVKDGKIHFSIPSQWDRLDKYMEFDAVLENDQLKGTITQSYGKVHSFTGERAPLLKRDKAPVWGKPINLL